LSSERYDKKQRKQRGNALTPKKYRSYKSDPLKIKNLSFINYNSEIHDIKFLGVYIDPELNFRYHIDYLRRKISNSLYFINRAKNLLTTNNRKYFIIH
jgi:hypothetical protein